MRDVCLDRDLSTKRNIHVLKCLGYAQLPPVSPSGGRALLWAGWVPAEQLNPTVLQSAGGMLCVLPLSPPPALPHSAKKILPKKLSCCSTQLPAGLFLSALLAFRHIQM